MHKARPYSSVYAGLLGLALLLPRTAAAGWPDSLVNVPLCTATGDQQFPTIAADSASGAIVTWADARNGIGNPDIYAQRISANGTVLWTVDGAALCTASGGQAGPTLVSDGAGGAIVVWLSGGSISRDIYAQRILADGTVHWTADGVALCTVTGRGLPCLTIAADGAGGAIVTWDDGRNGNNDIYAQRISAEGTVQWTADGVALCTASGSQLWSTSVSDGAGGVIVVWQDWRGADFDIYAQRISADGTVRWAADGVALCTANDRQQTPTIVSDGAGGAIVTWDDARSGSDNRDIYAQRISAEGTVQWAADGVALCTATGIQQAPTIISNGVSGAIVTWMDSRYGTNNSLYVQRISAAGTVQWAPNGVALCTATGQQEIPTITSDGAGGAIVTWEEARSGNWGIYAQRISAGGTVHWTTNGVALCSATAYQYYAAPTLVSDNAGGAIVTWSDVRSGNSDIYAQRVWADGSTPVLLSFVSVDVTADAITLTWLTSGSGSGVAAIYRSPVGGEWTRIGEVTADGTGYLRYTDYIDATATRVGYRLGIVDAGIEGFYGETWVDLPPRDAALAFALDPVRPNPTLGGALTVRFTLPSAASARVELVDVSGRRVVEREIGSLGAGQHTLDLGEGQHIAPGLYLVRLTQGANIRVTRVAVL